MGKPQRHLTYVHFPRLKAVLGENELGAQMNESYYNY